MSANMVELEKTGSQAVALLHGRFKRLVLCNLTDEAPGRGVRSRLLKLAEIRASVKRMIYMLIRAKDAFEASETRAGTIGRLAPRSPALWCRYLLQKCRRLQELRAQWNRDGVLLGEVVHEWKILFRTTAVYQEGLNRATGEWNGVDVSWQRQRGLMEWCTDLLEVDRQRRIGMGHINQLLTELHNMGWDRKLGRWRSDSDGMWKDICTKLYGSAAVEAITNDFFGGYDHYSGGHNGIDRKRKWYAV